MARRPRRNSDCRHRSLHLRGDRHFPRSQPGRRRRRVSAAEAAQSNWANTTPSERAEIFRKAADILERRQTGADDDGLARLGHPATRKGGPTWDPLDDVDASQESCSLPGMRSAACRPRRRGKSGPRDRGVKGVAAQGLSVDRRRHSPISGMRMWISLSGALSIIWCMLNFSAAIGSRKPPRRYFPELAARSRRWVDPLCSGSTPNAFALPAGLSFFATRILGARWRITAKYPISR
jgi:hypothetical protein